MKSQRSKEIRRSRRGGWEEGWYSFLTSLRAANGNFKYVTLLYSITISPEEMLIIITSTHIPHYRHHHYGPEGHRCHDGSSRSQLTVRNYIRSPGLWPSTHLEVRKRTVYLFWFPLTQNSKRVPPPTPNIPTDCRKGLLPGVGGMSSNLRQLGENLVWNKLLLTPEQRIFRAQCLSMGSKQMNLLIPTSRLCNYPRDGVNKYHRAMKAAGQSWKTNLDLSDLKNRNPCLLVQLIYRD